MPHDGVACRAVAEHHGEAPAAPDHARRARFLQTVAEAQATVLPDNIDYLFHPRGVELPDPAHVGARLDEQLSIIERATTLWDALGDGASRDLLLRFFAYRALGPVHVRLQLEPAEYRHTVINLGSRALRKGFVTHFPDMPVEWQVHHYDLRPFGLPLEVVGSPLPLASTMAFSQYAYRDQSVTARPLHGDVVLDAGGCWGDTALWFAHAVGPGGLVHTFEPTPGNRQLLDHNLTLNPVLAPRIHVWSDPLGPEDGTEVFMPDVIAAGATLQPTDIAGEFGTIAMRTQTIDSMVRGGAIPRIDFLKVDVEGADVGVLEGAAETIRTQRPRLAIACYHKPDDLVAIPDFVAGLGVDYRWYLQCS
ncbi:MAG: FkbM family methyltransferase, partial [Solirubrobacteraceae bacterium]